MRECTNWYRFIIIRQGNSTTIPNSSQSLRPWTRRVFSTPARIASNSWSSKRKIRSCSTTCMVSTSQTRSHRWMASKRSSKSRRQKVVWTTLISIGLNNFKIGSSQSRTTMHTWRPKRSTWSEASRSWRMKALLTASNHLLLTLTSQSIPGTTRRFRAITWATWTLPRRWTSRIPSNRRRRCWAVRRASQSLIYRSTSRTVCPSAVASYRKARTTGATSTSISIKRTSSANLSRTPSRQAFLIRGQRLISKTWFCSMTSKKTLLARERAMVRQAYTKPALRYPIDEISKWWTRAGTNLISEPRAHWTVSRWRHSWMENRSKRTSR